MAEGFRELEVERWTFGALEFIRWPDGRLLKVDFSVLGGHYHLFEATMSC